MKAGPPALVRILEHYPAFQFFYTLIVVVFVLINWEEAKLVKSNYPNFYESGFIVCMVMHILVFVGYLQTQWEIDLIEFFFCLKFQCWSSSLVQMSLQVCMSIIGLVGLSEVNIKELPWMGKILYVYMLLSLIPLTFMIVAISQMVVGFTYVCLSALI